MGFRTGVHPLGGGKKDPYKKETVLFESSTPGTYSLNLKTGVYEIWICGGGSGGGHGMGMNKKHYSGGGGAAFKGEILLPKGDVSLTIGAGGSGRGVSGGASALGNLIICGGGIGNYTDAGTGGSLTMNITPISSEIQSNGLNGSQVSLLGNGYGAAGYSEGSGTSGYIKIIYKRLKA